MPATARRWVGSHASGRRGHAASGRTVVGGTMNSQRPLVLIIRMDAGARRFFFDASPSAQRALPRTRSADRDHPQAPAWQTDPAKVDTPAP